MLLLVALAAAIIGWRTAVETLRRIDVNGQRQGLDMYIRHTEKDIANCEQKVNDGKDYFGMDPVKALKMLHSDLDKIKAERDSLK